MVSDHHHPELALLPYNPPNIPHRFGRLHIPPDVRVTWGSSPERVLEDQSWVEPFAPARDPYESWEDE